MTRIFKLWKCSCNLFWVDANVFTESIHPTCASKSWLGLTQAKQIAVDLRLTDHKHLCLSKCPVNHGWIYMLVIPWNMNEKYDQNDIWNMMDLNCTLEICMYLLSKILRFPEKTLYLHVSVEYKSTIPRGKNETHEPECWHVCWGRKAIFITFSRHSCGTPWHDTLIWQSGRTLLLDNIAQHPCETLLLDTLIWHSDLTLLWATLTWHSCGALLLDTFVGRSYLTRFLDTLTCHCCKTLWLDTLLGHSSGHTLPWLSCGTLLLDIPLEHPYRTLFVRRSYLTLL